MEQYTDYINRYHAQKEREEQLVKQYSDRPVSAPKVSLWMHTGIDRVSSTKGSNIEGLIIIAVAIIFFAALIIYGTDVAVKIK